MTKTKERTEPEVSELEILRERLADHNSRIDDLIQEQRDVTAEIGAQRAAGISLNGGRERRREIREELEDLSASIPFLESRIAELEAQ